MDKHEAIEKLWEMVKNHEPGYTVAEYYLMSLSNTTGEEYELFVRAMLEWINKPESYCYPTVLPRMPPEMEAKE